jgi:uncharacterized protein (DUF1697 family)
VRILETYVALLRGINVGGKNRLPMTDLRERFIEAGCGEVRSYIQSGNVIFTAPPSLAASLPGIITAGIAATFGYRTPVLLRSADQLREVLTTNPFLRAGATEDTLHVMFLADRPSSDRVDILDPDRSPGDAFAVRGQEIYLCLPNCVAETKLSNAYFDTKLGTTSTGRNWRTVAKLLALMEG